MKVFKKHIAAFIILILIAAFSLPTYADFVVHKDRLSPQSIKLLKQYLFLNCLKITYKKQVRPIPGEVIRRINNQITSIIETTSYGAVDFEKSYALAEKQGNKLTNNLLTCLNWSMSKETDEQIMKILTRDRMLDPE